MRRIKNGEIPNYNFELAIKKPFPIRFRRMEEDFEIETMEGILNGKKGDYLLIGVDGEMYPCKDKIFEKTYEFEPANEKKKK